MDLKPPDRVWRHWTWRRAIIVRSHSPYKFGKRRYVQLTSVFASSFEDNNDAIKCVISVISYHPGYWRECCCCNSETKSKTDWKSCSISKTFSKSCSKTHIQTVEVANFKAKFQGEHLGYDILRQYSAFVSRDQFIYLLFLRKFSVLLIWNHQPSASPTFRPSPLPSSQPTSQPTVLPTTQPTGQPSSQPTMTPTMKVKTIHRDSTTGKYFSAGRWTLL